MVWGAAVVSGEQALPLRQSSALWPSGHLGSGPYFPRASSRVLHHLWTEIAVAEANMEVVVEVVITPCVRPAH